MIDPRPSSRRRAVLAGTALTILLGATSGADADTLYRLHDHADGNAGPPTYGLRLDNLFEVAGFNVGGGDVHNIYTFSFDHDGAAMWMRHDGDVIDIWGIAYGGLNEGDGYAAGQAGWVEIAFTYDMVGTVAGDDDLFVPEWRPPNEGTIGDLGGNWEIALYDFAGSHDYTFRFGDGDDDQGHRGFDGLSGWGWLNHSDPFHHEYASDWLFTGQVIPVPPALGLGAVGLAGLIVGARRRRVKARRA